MKWSNSIYFFNNNVATSSYIEIKLLDFKLFSRYFPNVLILAFICRYVFIRLSRYDQKFIPRYTMIINLLSFQFFFSMKTELYYKCQNRSLKFRQNFVWEFYAFVQVFAVLSSIKLNFFDKKQNKIEKKYSNFAKFGIITQCEIQKFSFISLFYDFMYCSKMVSTTEWSLECFRFA